MPHNVQVQKSVTVLGSAYAVNETLQADLGIPFNITLPAAKNGTLTTRTSNTVGTLTMSGGHGIITGDRLDIYWDGGSRIGVTVGTVATNSVPFSLGDGDNLPIATTVITAMVPNERSLVVTGDDVTVITGYCVSGCTVAITKADDTPIYTVQTSSDQPAYSWTSLDGSTNPVAGDTVGKIYLSHPNSTQSVTVRGALMYD